MSKNKYKRQIRKLVQLLIKYNVSSIYITDIAEYLQCSEEVVEDELYMLAEEGILQHVFELHCCVCDHVITSSESPTLLTGGTVECPWCLSQPETITMDDLVHAFAIIEQDNN